jgi:acetyl esterase
MKYLLAFVIASLPLTTFAQQPPASWPPRIDGEKQVYKTVGDRELCLWRIAADSSSGNKESGADKSPAIVFFFGGGWTSGTPEQFLPQAKYLASRGMTTFVADYRVASRDKVKAAACVEDAKSAVRWLRANAEKLAIDPNRICAAGGSAGGHIACATALLPGLDARSDDLAVSSVPNALALFNPAVVLAPIDGLPTPKEAETRLEGLKSRLGAEPEAMSPAHHVRSGLPPAIIFHGEADTTVLPATVQKFTNLMKDAGNRCELKTYPRAPHSFFNLPGNKGAAGKKKDANKKSEGQDQRSVWHRQTLRELDLFLVSLGWISGEPTIPEMKTR